MINANVTVDFVAEGDAPNEWKLVIVEEGPWSDVSEELRRVQERLYSCIDAALDGQLAEAFPQTLGKKIVVQLYCYNLPEESVATFFERFSLGVFSVDDYRQALQSSQFVNGIDFKVCFDQID